MPTLARAVIPASLALLLVGCGDQPIEVPADAVSEASHIMGGSARDALPLTPEDIELLADTANVEQDVLESAAGSLGDSDVWTLAMAGLQTIYDDAPQGVESTLVDVACQAVTGARIHTDYQLHYAIFQRVSGFDTAEIDRLTETTFDLYRGLYDAGDSDRAEDRAAVVLTCHVLEAALT